MFSVAALAVLGAHDALSGAAAALTYVATILVLGGLPTANGARSTAGLIALWFAPALIAAAVRPVSSNARWNVDDPLGTRRRLCPGADLRSLGGAGHRVVAERAVRTLPPYFVVHPDHRMFPDDAIVREEFGSFGVASRTWTVDPIDGTSFFAKSDPNWRIHLAFRIDERIELAVVAAPALGLRWWAQRGEGAFEAVWPTERTRPTRLA